MKNLVLLGVIGVVIVALAGCAVNTKLIERERVDQEISSMDNQGYLFGTPPPAATRKATREYFEVQVELPPPIEKESRVPKEEIEEMGVYAAPEISEPEEVFVPEVKKEEYVTYKVRKGDTLQKISQKFYGTTKKWRKIFLANKDKLKNPDKVRAGQTLRIPQAVGESEYIK